MCPYVVNTGDQEGLERSYDRDTELGYLSTANVRGAAQLAGHQPAVCHK